MSGDGFNVELSELRTHSDTVGRVAKSIEEAATAAATERAGGLVYGVLFDVIAQPFLNMWADSIHGYVANNGEVAQSISKGLADNADSYESTESDNKDNINKAGKGA
jgi:hypothetical protein